MMNYEEKEEQIIDNLITFIEDYERKNLSIRMSGTSKNNKKRKTDSVNIIISQLEKEMENED